MLPVFYFAPTSYDARHTCDSLRAMVLATAAGRGAAGSKMTGSTILRTVAVVTVFVASAISVTESEHVVDYRRTIIRPGYGVNFDRVGNVVVDGGVSYYTHTWALPWPRIHNCLMPSFNCSSFASWRGRCRAINSYIESTNDYVYDMFSKTVRFLEKGKKMIPPGRWPSQPESSSRPGRRKRHAVLPDWLKQSQPHDELSDYLPTRAVGTIWSGLTNSPGPKDTKRLEQHLRDVGSAVYENVENIRQLNSDIESMALLTDRRINDLVRAADVVHGKIKNVSRNIYLMADTVSAGMDRLAARVNLSSRIDDVILTEVVPVISNFLRSVTRVDTESRKWMSGITALTRGYLSPLLISETEIDRVLRHVVGHVLKKPVYSDMKLISLLPSYYYQLKNVLYSHRYDLRNATAADGSSTLYVTLKVPLYRIGGTFPVYRVDVYPVPNTAGTTRRASGFSLVKDMPDFIAVSTDHENYFEMSTSFFLSCSGDVGAKTCTGSGMPVLKKRRARQTSCAFALFIEDVARITTGCDYRYADKNRWKPYGSAVQLTADSTFLMHASQRGEQRDRWSISCPLSPRNPQSPVAPCDMCRLTVPCFCSLSAADFYLPQRITGCTTATDGGGGGGAADVSFIYHLNTAIVTSLYPDATETARYLSYKNFSRKHHRFDLEIPDIQFATSDDFSDYVSVGDAFSAKLSDTLRRQQAGMISYESKIDAALNRTRDFRDQIVDRSGDISKAVNDLFSGVFGSKIGHVLALVASPVGLLMITFVFSAFDFFPILISDYRAWAAKKQRARQDRRKRLTGREADVDRQT